MGNDFFKNQTAKVGGKEVAFDKREIRGNFLMYIPRSFSEDKSLVSNYSYLFNKDKSPLSIAVKFTQMGEGADRDKMIANYFSHSPESKHSAPESAGDGILFRETIASSDYMSVYSLRFSAEVEGGVLFGCFNCSDNYREDWKPVVLQMLRDIEKA